MSDNLYLVKCNGFYKIGVSSNIEKRIDELQTGNPYQLEIDVYYSSPVSDNIEKCLHNKFRDKHIRGEWFALDANDLDAIESICVALGAIRHDVSIFSSDKDYDGDEDEKASYDKFISICGDSGDKNIREVAEQLGIPRSTAYRWFSQYQESIKAEAEHV